MTCDHMAELTELRRRLCDALAERDHWRAMAEQRINLRRELEQALGVEHLHGDDQIRIALETIEAYRVNAGDDAERIAALEERLRADGVDVTALMDEVVRLRSRVAELEDALAVAQAEVAVERGRVADLTTMNVGLAAIVKDLEARLAALEDDLRQALAEREDDEP